jgi:thiol:disulfide interchange protein DsbD
VRLTGDGPVDWVYFTPERFRDAIGSKKTVLVVFTAEWCLNCKALEQAVIGSRKVSSLLAGEETVAMKVDITGDNPEGKKKLHELGQLSIPLLVIYSRQGKEVFRSDFYTVEQISEALVKAGADT